MGENGLRSEDVVGAQTPGLGRDHLGGPSAERGQVLVKWVLAEKVWLLFEGLP